jgi:CelD/BcsL family acetyltransferase involved in cellulose biosynthesis
MYVIDPLNDARWSRFVDQHISACAFHSEGWLRALRLTYSYEPFAVTSCAPGMELTDALPLCRVKSWLTGRRLVALPFTDHCQPLAGAGASTRTLIEFLTELAHRERYRFVEIRPAEMMDDADIKPENGCAAYYIHWLDLTLSLETIFNLLHKDSIQRKIRRAEREGLRYEDGRSSEIIKKFYGLLLRTRRRHQLPPQPVEWFENLAKTMGESIQVRVASKGDVPVAAIVTLTHRNSIIYKYGCSDERHHPAGSMPFLFWRMIQDAKEAGIPMVDFGRSDLDNEGLIRFKDQWGTRRTQLTYYRFPPPAATGAHFKLGGRAAKAIFARLPDQLLTVAGRLFYRHVG